MQWLLSFLLFFSVFLAEDDLYDWIAVLIAFSVLSELLGYFIPEGKLQRFVSVIFGVLALVAASDLLFFSGKNTEKDLSGFLKKELQREESLSEESFSYEDFVYGVYERQGVNIYVDEDA